MAKSLEHKIFQQINISQRKHYYVIYGHAFVYYLVIDVLFPVVSDICRIIWLYIGLYAANSYAILIHLYMDNILMYSLCMQYTCYEGARGCPTGSHGSSLKRHSLVILYTNIYLVRRLIQNNEISISKTVSSMLVTLLDFFVYRETSQKEGYMYTKQTAFNHKNLKSLGDKLSIHLVAGRAMYWWFFASGVIFMFTNTFMNTNAVHLLVYDPLNPDDTLYPFLLIPPKEECSAYGETLYPYGQITEELRNIIYKRLKCYYSTYSSKYDYYYVASGINENIEHEHYYHEKRFINEKGCHAYDMECCTEDDDYSESKDGCCESEDECCESNDDCRDDGLYIDKCQLERYGVENVVECLVLAIKDGKVNKSLCYQEYPSICTNSGHRRTHNTHVPKDMFPITVQSKFGTLTGTRSDITFLFLGIPYALPPVGDLRFEDPVPIEKLKTSWEATYYRSYCPQDSISVKNPILNEDCLYLNIYTPYVPGNGDSTDPRLPVMVWIHGGSFVRGDVSQPYHDPSHLAASQHVVVVSFNYRLGMLGFWGSRNQAIKDQITLLKWVQKFICDFGGDPTKGESAGAHSVRTLLSAKDYTTGLFSGAIGASDPIGLGFAIKKEAEGLASSFNCITHKSQSVYDKDVLECMRQVNVQDIIDTQELLGVYSSFQTASITAAETFKPVVDGDLLKGTFYELLESGSIVKVPVIYGSLKDEGHFFTPFYIDTPAPSSMFLLVLSIMTSFMDAFSIKNSGLYNYYTDSANDGARNAISDYTTVYGYYYTYAHLWLHSKDHFYYGRVCHADDIVTLLGSSAIPGVELFLFNKEKTTRTSDDITFFNILLERLGSFLRTRDPNPDPKTLCYNAKYFAEGSPSRKTLEWLPFSINTKLDPVPKARNGVENGKVYGTLLELNLPEKPYPYGCNRTICDFWFRQGIHAQLYSTAKAQLNKFKIMHHFRSF
ncbi:hypothetical protein PMAC_000799 [Pneumocystis sp. 'macacae']|nr:hypothetical protein PMAC_000799 [Pneumocystis sp. 'macacae']